MNLRFKEINELITRNHGIVTNKILAKNGINHYYLFSLAKIGKLIKVDKGIYSLKDDENIDELFLLQKRYPKIIFSFYTAANLLKLGENIPLKNDITLPHGYNVAVFDRKKYRIHTIDKKIHQLGVSTVNTPFGNPIRCYNQPRTVCDFIKHRNKIEPETFQKVLKDYFSSHDHYEDKLFEYAKKLKISRKVKDISGVLSE